MNDVFPIILALLVLGLLLTIFTVVIWKKRKGAKTETDYRAFYVLGICFAPLGIVLMITIGNPGMLGMTGLGVAYIAIGLANRDKWKKK